jgi:hypothetical protein
MTGSYSLEKCKHGMPKATCAYCNPRSVPNRSNLGSSNASSGARPELSGELLEQYVPLARAHLAEIARQKRTVNYSDIMNEFGGRGHIGKVLDEVNRREHAKGHPMLSALVVQKDTGRPGDGFWTLVAELFPTASLKGFWEAECERIWAFDWNKS